MSEVVGTTRAAAESGLGAIERDPEVAEPPGDSRNRRAMLRLVPVAAMGAVAAACKPRPPSVTTRPPSSTAVPPTTRPPTTVAPTTTVPSTTAPPKTTTTLPSTTTTTLPPLPPPPSGWADPAGLHAARRLTWGATPATAADIASRGLSTWLDEQIAWQGIDDSHLGSMLAPWPRPGWEAAQVKADKEWLVPAEMACHETIRRVYSRRQLHEVMVEFWHDHFNIYVNSQPSKYHFPSFDRTVIRPHALGRFADMLPAVAAHPAMLHYLNQATSRGDGGRIPNENFARELMELHTVGSGGGYVQEDVVAVSYLLTGWTATGKTGGFAFQPLWHNPGPMTPERVVLGWSRGALGGEAAGRAFMDHLARHPATARRLCHKLAVRVIGEHISADSQVVSSAAAAYLSADTSIAAALRSLVMSPEFAASAGARVRRPQSLVTQMARALQLGWVTPDPNQFLWGTWSHLEKLGHAPHTWPTPEGFPDDRAHWLSVGAMVSRWNLAVWFAYSCIPGMPFQANRTMEWAPNRRWGEWLDALARAFVGEPWPPEVRASVLAHYGVTDTTVFRSWDHWAAAPVVTLLLQTPAFQRH